MHIALSQASCNPGIVLPGLVTCYEFHSPNCMVNNGTLIKDMCPSGNTGTAGTPLFSYNPNTGSVRVNTALTNCWTCGNTGLTSMPAITILTWTNFSGGSGTQGGIVSGGNAGARNFQLVVRNNFSSFTGMDWYSVATGEFTSNAVASVTGWHLWGVTSQGTALRWYMDGGFINQSTTPSNTGTTSGTSMVIGYDFYSTYFTGFIQSLYIYNRVLTDAEVSACYNATRWRFGL